jgi:hypothetical protein
VAKYSAEQYKNKYKELVSQGNSPDAVSVRNFFLEDHPEEAKTFFEGTGGWAQFKSGAAKGLLNLGEALDVIDPGKLLWGGRDFSRKMAEARRKDLSQYEASTPPTTGFEEWAQKAGEITGGTAPFVPLGPVGALLRGGVGVGGRGLLTEIAATGGAAAGGATASQIWPGSVPAEIAGQIVGAAPSTIASLLFGKGKALLGAGVSTAKQEAINTATAGARAAYENIPEDVLRSSTKSAEAIGLPTTLAERVGSPELLGIQKNLITEGIVSPASEVQRAAQAQQALKSFAESGAAPAATGNAQALIEQAAAKAQKAIEDARGGLGGVRQEAGELVEKLPPTFTIETGRGLRDELIAAERSARDEFSNLAETLGLNNANLYVPFKGFQKAVGDAFKGGQFAETASLPTETLKNIEGAKKVTFGDLTELRSVLLKNIREADAQNKTILSGNYKLILRKLDETLDNAEGSFGTLADRYKTFRQSYKTNVIDPFEDKLFKATQTNGRDFYVTNDESLASLFLKGPTEARQFRAVAKDSPSMIAAMESAVFDSLRSKAVKDGAIDPQKLMKWIADNNKVLNELPPQIKQKVMDVEARTNALASRADQIGLNIAKAEDAYLAKAAQKFAGEKKFSFDDLVGEVLSNPKSMSSLVADLTPEAKTALQRHVWDSVYRGQISGTELVSKNRESLSKLFPEKDLDTLAFLADGVAQVGRLPDYLTKTGFDESQLNLYRKFLRSIGQTERSITSTGLSVSRGRSGVLQELAGVLGRLSSTYGKRKTAEAMKAALYDKDALAALKAMESPDPKKAERGANWFRAWMGGLLPTAFGEEE